MAEVLACMRAELSHPLCVVHGPEDVSSGSLVVIHKSLLDFLERHALSKQVLVNWQYCLEGSLKGSSEGSFEGS